MPRNAGKATPKDLVNTLAKEEDVVSRVRASINGFPGVCVRASMPFPAAPSGFVSMSRVLFCCLLQSPSTASGSAPAVRSRQNWRSGGGQTSTRLVCATFFSGILRKSPWANGSRRAPSLCPWLKPTLSSGPGGARPGTRTPSGKQSTGKWCVRLAHRCLPSP